MTKKSLVVKDNRLIEACYRLDLSEQRLILLAIVRAREAKQKITADTWLEVSVKDYNDTYDLTRTTGYKLVQTAALSLFNRYVRITLKDDATGKNSELSTRWVSACHYVEDASLVRIQLASLMIPYVSNLESKFTSYQLKNVAQMTSAYAIRLFELMMQYRAIGGRYITIEDLKEYLGATGEGYVRMDNFKNKVVVPAITQINKFTELNVTFENRKSGRNVIGYDFKVTDKEVEQPKPTAKKSKKSPASLPPPLPASLSLSEVSMLRKLNEQRSPDNKLTDAQIFDMCRDQSTEPFLLLDTLLKS